MSDNLDNLRKIAEAANPGPWETLGGQGPFGTHAVCHRMEQGTLVEIAYRDAHFDKANAVHIATFDPPTVLALLTRLEQAEQQVARVRDVIKGAPTVDPLRGFADPPDDWPDDTDFTSYGEWIMANRVREALDGDGRRLADQGLGGEERA